MELCKPPYDGNLLALSREQLLRRCVRLELVSRAQAQTIVEIAEERDAARLLNELCHY